MEDSLDLYDEIYESYDDEGDCWEDSVSFDAHHNLYVRSVEQLWTNYLETAPEDENTPSSSSFPDYLSFMEMVYAESLKHLWIFWIHMCTRSSPRRPRSWTKGAKVFVPQNWEGIKVKLLHIVFIEGMTAIMKRPIYPKQFEHFKKEFDRLLSSMYVRCDGPVGSPLVIAPKATAPFIRFCGDYQAVNKFILH